MSHFDDWVAVRQMYIGISKGRYGGLSTKCKSGEVTIAQSLELNPSPMSLS